MFKITLYYLTNLLNWTITQNSGDKMVTAILLDLNNTLTLDVRSIIQRPIVRCVALQVEGLGRAMSNKQKKQIEACGSTQDLMVELKKLFPQEENLKRCAKAIQQIIMKTISARGFTLKEGAKDFLQSPCEGPVLLFISSDIPSKEPVQKLLKEEGLTKLFSGIYTAEDGPKKEHVSVVRQGIKIWDQLAYVVCVGDSPKDMIPSADYCLGLCSLEASRETIQALMDAGANNISFSFEAVRAIISAITPI